MNKRRLVVTSLTVLAVVASVMIVPNGYASKESTTPKNKVKSTPSAPTEDMGKRFGLTAKEQKIVQEVRNFRRNLKRGQCFRWPSRVLDFGMVSYREGYVTQLFDNDPEGRIEMRVTRSNSPTDVFDSDSRVLAGDRSALLPCSYDSAKIKIYFGAYKKMTGEGLYERQ